MLRGGKTGFYEAFHRFPDLPAPSSCLQEDALKAFNNTISAFALAVLRAVQTLKHGPSCTIYACSPIVLHRTTLPMYRVIALLYVALQSLRLLC